MVKDSMNEGLPSQGQPGNNATVLKYIGVAAVVVIVGIGSFLGGVQYQKGQTSSTTTASTQTGAGGFGSGSGGFGARRSGGFGTVTAVSSTSITISETTPGGDSSSSGTSKTYAITSSTTVTDNGQSASISDIQSGDRVIIRTSSTDTTTATAIMVNPTFGGGGAPGGQTQSDGSTDNSDTSVNSSST